MYSCDIQSQFCVYGRSPTQIEHEEDTCSSIWQHCPDSILMQIFSNLNGQELLISSMTCKVRFRIILNLSFT